MVNDLAQLDATAQADLVRREVCSPLELVDIAISRIEALNSSLNAMIVRSFGKQRRTLPGR